MEFLTVIILACQVHTAAVLPEDVMRTQRTCQRDILVCVNKKHNVEICLRETGK